MRRRFFSHPIKFIFFLNSSRTTSSSQIQRQQSNFPPTHRHWRHSRQVGSLTIQNCRSTRTKTHVLLRKRPIVCRCRPRPILACVSSMTKCSRSVTLLSILLCIFQHVSRIYVVLAHRSEALAKRLQHMRVNVHEMAFVSIGVRKDSAQWIGESFHKLFFRVFSFSSLNIFLPHTHLVPLLSCTKRAAATRHANRWKRSQNYCSPLQRYKIRWT